MAAAACRPLVSGDRPGGVGTSHAAVYDSDTAIFFRSTYNNWQFIQIDFNCVGELKAFRRYMSRDGLDTSGYRGAQGESLSYSLDGTIWIELTSSMTHGWQGYVNYGARLTAWHSVEYGWSAWLNLNTPAKARYVRFGWDSNRDAVNEIEFDFTELVRLPLPLALPDHHPWPMLGYDSSHRSFTDLNGPDDPTILQPWPFQVNAPIHSAPVIGMGGTAFFGTDDGYLYAVRPAAADPAILRRWRFSAGNGIWGAPALKATHPEFGSYRVYFATETGDIYSLDASDGTVVWNKRLNVGVQSSPVVVTPPDHLARVYLVAEDGIYAFQESGSASSPSANLAWRYGLTPTRQNKTSVAVSNDNAHIYATDAAQMLYFLDAQTGSELCSSVRLSGALTGPLVDPNGYVYVGSARGPDSGTLYSYAVYEFGSTCVCRQRWSLQFDRPITLTPALAPNGLITVVSGTTLYAVDRFDGSLACNDCWQLDVPWVEDSPPVVDGSGVVYLAGSDRKVHAIHNGQLKWEADVDQRGMFTAPAIDGLGRLYIGSLDANLYVLQDDPALKIAFESDYSTSTNMDVHTLREIYGVTDRRRIVRVIDNPDVDGQPTYSTDGHWLAFASDRHGSMDVFLGTSGGLELRNLTSAGTTPFTRSSNETQPVFSPTDLEGRSKLRLGGHYLAVTVEIDDNVKQLYFIDLVAFLKSGTVNAIRLPDWLNRYGVTSTAEQHGQAAFSPNGRYLAYSAYTFERGMHLYELVLVDLNLGRRSALLSERHTGAQANTVPNFSPAFAPDSRKLVFDGGGGRLVVIDIEEGNRFALQLPSPLDAHHPAWSPDGTEIAFVGAELAASEISIAKGPRYSNHKPLTNVLNPVSRAIFEHAEYHPFYVPEPRLTANCAEGQPTVEPQPTVQQPRNNIEVRGCGFDIKFPSRNQVYFVGKHDRFRWVEGTVVDAWVDVEGGLGVLQVRVPELAGNGPIAVVTPYGRAESGAKVADCRDADPNNDKGCFRVLPEPMKLAKPASIPGAKIRILGYGFQLYQNYDAANPPSPRSHVFFLPL